MPDAQPRTRVLSAKSATPSTRIVTIANTCGTPKPPCWKIPSPVSAEAKVPATKTTPAGPQVEISLSRASAMKPAASAIRLIAVWIVPSGVRPSMSGSFSKSCADRTAGALDSLSRDAAAA